MIKILFFIDTLSAGGAEKVLQTLVNNMDRQKFDITVHTLEAADPRGVLADGVRYRAINRCKTPWGKKLFSYWLRLCAELNWLYPLYIRDDYDMEVAYLECAPTKFLAGSTNMKAKKIAWVHCDLEKKEGMVAQCGKLKQQYNAYDKIVCVSENVKESFVRMFGREEDTLVLYNVNDEADIHEKATEYPVPKAEGCNFVALGRLTWQKGFDRLLDVCGMLVKAGYIFRLQILGEGPERDSLEAQIRCLGLEKQVQLLGFQNNPYPYLRAADVFVCSSRYEGLSTAVIESLILGKPIVTTHCTGMAELLGESQYGLITEDTVAGLYNGMKKLLDDPQLRDRYARAAEKRGRQFEKKTILAQTEAFFCSELEKKRSKA